jgi:hypothetical protein
LLHHGFKRIDVFLERDAAFIGRTILRVGFSIDKGFLDANVFFFLQCFQVRARKDFSLVVLVVHDDSIHDVENAKPDRPEQQAVSGPQRGD